MNEVRVKALQLFNWILLPGILCLFILRININDPHASIVSGGDGLLNLYFLENNYKLWSELFSTGFSDYYSPDFFWPTKNVFAFSDHLFSPGIFYSLIKSFIKSKSIAFTLWIYGTLLINYWSLRACLCVSNKWRSPFIASIITAAAVFSPVAIQDGLGHVQLLSMFTIGPIIYRLNLIFRHDKIPSQKDLLILMTLLVIQSTFNIYTCVFIAYCVSVALLIQFAVVVRRFRINPKKNVLHEARKPIHTFRPRQLLREKNLLLFLSASILIAILIHLPYLETINKFGDRGPLDEAQMAQPLSLLKGSAGLLLKSPFEIIQGFDKDLALQGWEQTMFPGYLFTALFAIALTFTTLKKIRQRESELQLSKELSKWAVFSLVAWTGSIHIIDGHSLYGYISPLIPGASALRAPSRIVAVLVYFSSPFIYLVLARTRRLINSNSINIYAKSLATAALVASVARSDFGSFNYSLWNSSVASIEKELSNSSCDFFFIDSAQTTQGNPLPVGERHLLGMHSSQASGIPTINGTSGFIVQEEFPYEAERNDGLKAVGWAHYNSSIGNKKTFKGVKSQARYCVVNHLQKPVATNVLNIISPHDAIYPRELFKNNRFVVLRGNNNELVIGEFTENRWPLFRTVLRYGVEAKVSNKLFDELADIPATKMISVIEEPGKIKILNSTGYAYPGEELCYIRTIDAKTMVVTERQRTRCASEDFGDKK